MSDAQKWRHGDEVMSWSESTIQEGARFQASPLLLIQASALLRYVRVGRGANAQVLSTSEADVFAT